MTLFEIADGKVFFHLPEINLSTIPWYYYLIAIAMYGYVVHLSSLRGLNQSEHKDKVDDLQLTVTMCARLILAFPVRVLCLIIGILQFLPRCIVLGQFRNNEMLRIAYSYHVSPENLHEIWAIPETE